MAAKLEMGLQKKEEAIGVQGVNPVRGRRGAPFFLAFFAFFVFFCWDLAPAALADKSGLEEASPTVPQRPEEVFLYDQAGLLSEETKTALREKNADLTEKYGVQIAVYTVDTLPYTDFTQRVGFLRSVMEQWQIGGAGGRGLILALSVSDADYLAVAGSGLQGEFTTEALKSLLDTCLEADFSAKSYDTGVQKFVTSAAEKAQAYCAAHPEMFTPQEAASQLESSGVNLAKEKGPGLGPFLWVLLALGLVVLGCVGAFFFRYGQMTRRRSRRTVHRRSPVIRPARATVTRQETRPSVQVKAGSRSTGVYRDRRPRGR